MHRLSIVVLLSAAVLLAFLLAVSATSAIGQELSETVFSTGVTLQLQPALFSHTGPSGSSTTGKWVSQGTIFFLQDVSAGRPLTSANTLATITVNLTTSGCS